MHERKRRTRGGAPRPEIYDIWTLQLMIVHRIIANIPVASWTERRPPFVLLFPQKNHTLFFPTVVVCTSLQSSPIGCRQCLCHWTAQLAQDKTCDHIKPVWFDPRQEKEKNLPLKQSRTSFMTTIHQANMASNYQGLLAFNNTHI